MGALPVTIETERSLPDYLPARMVNEFAYCPRLFFYEWVEGLFEESSDTVEGAIQHQRVDAKATALPESADLPGSEGTPVDYKHGRPREGAGGLELWPSDRAQLAVQGMVLRENGYRCEEGIVYYRKTGQRVRVAFDEQLMAATEGMIQRAWSTAAAPEIPPPLVDSPKCPGCSLVGICLPDETLVSEAAEREAEPEQLGLFETGRRKPAKREVRPLVTPRSELRPLYLNSQGVRVGKSGAVDR